MLSTPIKPLVWHHPVIL